MYSFSIKNKNSNNNNNNSKTNKLDQKNVSENNKQLALKLQGLKVQLSRLKSENIKLKNEVFTVREELDLVRRSAKHFFAQSLANEIQFKNVVFVDNVENNKKDHKKRVSVARVTPWDNNNNTTLAANNEVKNKPCIISNLSIDSSSSVLENTSDFFSHEAGIKSHILK